MDAPQDSVSAAAAARQASRPVQEVGLVGRAAGELERCPSRGSGCVVLFWDEWLVGRTGAFCEARLRLGARWRSVGVVASQVRAEQASAPRLREANRDWLEVGTGRR